MSERPVAIVVGAGAGGLGIALALAEREWSVEVIDQGRDHAASATPSRFLRWAHGLNVGYTELATESLRRWRKLEAETNAQLFLPVGVAWIARSDESWLEDSCEALDEVGVDSEVLSHDQVGTVLPGAVLDEDESLLIERSAGLLRASACLDCLVERAIALGVRFCSGRAEPAGGRVRWEGEELVADATIWAAGAWMTQLFPDVIHATVTRQDTLYLESPSLWDGRPVPAWIDFSQGLYGAPDVDGAGMKIGFDEPGRQVLAPDQDDGPGDVDAESRLRESFGRRFPSLPQGPALKMETCHYGLTPDSEWIVARHPSDDRAWLVGGDSGHAFKHALLVGELVADDVEGRSPLPPEWGTHRRAETVSNMRTSIGN